MQTSTTAGPTAKRAISLGRSTMKAKPKPKRKPTAKPNAATTPVLGQPLDVTPANKKQKPLPPWLMKAKKKQSKVRKQR